MDPTIFVGFYVAGFLFTLLYLAINGRPGLKRRVLQTGAATCWPAYWLLIQGPRSTLVVLLKVVSFAVLTLTLIALIPFVALERRHFIS